MYLSDDSVRGNIAFGVSQDDVDMDKVIRAAKSAEIHDFIENELEGKYDEIVGERGIRLSGGQIQRIGIARALYNDPEVLVMDEATSALDNNTEKNVLNALENAAKSKTLIIIAHRLTTVKECDTIYLMEQGKILASGTYSELLEKSEKFRVMASSVEK